MIMMKCDPFARAQCPHGAYCEAFAVYTDESECAKFNQSVLAKPKTNADRIRSMSDEELAEVLGKLVHCGGCPMRDNCKVDDLPCNNVMLEWLKQLAEE
jgi:hypothetical protein